MEEKQEQKAEGAPKREHLTGGYLEREYLARLCRPLLDWYYKNRRSLPWREEVTPYRVWISEIMLQQTRVEAGRGYFERFVRELPTVSALANADDETLMKLWEGLGYYSRARNLKKAAGIVIEKYSGKLPDSYKELLTLPGIGPYTAGAIASIAFGEAVPAVDGNVLRVISRFMACREDISLASVKKAVEAALLEIMPKDQPGDFNQALMELGAIVCLPNGAPKCGECPVSGLCRARKEGLCQELPVKRAKKERRIEEKTVFILTDRYGRMALRRRPEKGLLSGMWELPSLPAPFSQEEAAQAFKQWGVILETGASLEEAGQAKHIFSHVEWHMTGYQAQVRRIQDSQAPCTDRESAVLLMEEDAVYLRDIEEKKRSEDQKQRQRQKLIFVDGESLRDRYALPSAFKGFSRWFPEAGPEKEKSL